MRLTPPLPGAHLPSHPTSRRCCDLRRWRFTEHESHSSVYRSTHINSPRDWNTFADHPHAEGTPRSMHWSDVQKYIERFVDEMGVGPHLRLSTT